MQRDKNFLEGQWPNKPFLTEEDLMQLFSVSKSSIRRWRKNKVIPFVKLGGTYFTPLHILIDFVSQRTEGSLRGPTHFEEKGSQNGNANDED